MSLITNWSNKCEHIKATFSKEIVNKIHFITTKKMLYNARNTKAETFSLNLNWVKKTIQRYQLKQEI